MEDYNYREFDLRREDHVFDAFKRKLFVGERARSFPLEDLATGQSVPLKRYWADGPAVLEFGSFT